MALADLLRVIEADAAAERARADREAAAEAAAIVAPALAREAAALSAELAAAPEPAARADAERTRALARLDAAAQCAARARRRSPPCSRASVPSSPRCAPAGPIPALPALLAESRAALPGGAELRVDPRDLDLATALAGGLRVDPTLDTWGGVELAGDDGRTIRNTLEERLANAEPCCAEAASREWLRGWR